MLDKLARQAGRVVFGFKDPGDGMIQNEMGHPVGVFGGKHDRGVAPVVRENTGLPRTDCVEDSDCIPYLQLERGWIIRRNRIREPYAGPVIADESAERGKGLENCEICGCSLCDSIGMSQLMKRMSIGPAPMT